MSPIGKPPEPPHRGLRGRSNPILTFSRTS
jgi:hypothetical protein